MSSKTKTKGFDIPRPTVGETYVFNVYGKQTECEVLRVYDFGTADVLRLSDGEAFRLTGLGWF